MKMLYIAMSLVMISIMLFGCAKKENTLPLNKTSETPLKTATESPSQASASTSDTDSTINELNASMSEVDNTSGLNDSNMPDVDQGLNDIQNLDFG